MYSKGVTLEDSSNWWYYNDEIDQGTWHFSWHNRELAYDFLNFDIYEKFLDRYIRITQKYKILLPTINLFFTEFSEKDAIEFSKNKIIHSIKEELNIIGSNDAIIANYKKAFRENLIKNNIYTLNNLYGEKNKQSYPTLLFIKKNHIISKTHIININDLSGLDTNKNSFQKSNSCDEPIRIIHQGTSFTLNIRNDIFFTHLGNKKTSFSTNQNIREYGVNNSELAYLNTPRINSFLRDFKNLCLDFGAECSFESGASQDTFGQEKIIEEGILLDGEIIYYEDIVDLLDVKYVI